MKIEFNQKTYMFNEIKVGEAFLYGKDMCLKVFHKETQGESAVNLESGEYVKIGSYAKVVPVDAVIKWKNKMGEI